MEEERERSDKGETGASHPVFRTENKLGGEGAPSCWSWEEDATSLSHRVTSTVLSHHYFHPNVFSGELR